MSKTEDSKEKLNIIDSNSPFSVIEAYKTLRANLQFVCPHEGCKIICVTSSIAHEGKSSTSINLAIAISETEQKVLYIDGDMRASRIARDLSLSSKVGLAEILAGVKKVTDDGIIQHFGNNNFLDIIVAGKNPPNPSELLYSERMVELLEEAKKNYDYVIIDGAPIGIVSDVLVLSPHIDGYVLVVRADETTRLMLQDSISSIKRVGGKVLGLILNGVKTKGSSYGKYGKYGKYGSYYGK